MDWVTCSDCDTEFRVISDSDNSITCCPFCGTVLDIEDDIEDDEYS